MIDYGHCMRGRDSEVDTVVHTSRPIQNGNQFTDNIFYSVSLNENLCILIQISLNMLKFVLKGLTDSIPALVQIKARHQTGNKPVSEAMMALFTNAYLHHSAGMG